MERITSRQNSAAVHLKRLGNDAGYRAECREFLCDGPKLLEEAVEWNVKIKTVMFTGDAAPEVMQGTRLISVPAELLESVSPLQSPQGILFSCEMFKRDTKFSGDRHIILENMQDPGNVGAVLRTAAAFAVDTVMLLGNCADPYSPKAVRASMGAVFRQRFLALDDIDELKSTLNDRGIKLLGASLGEGCRDICEMSLERTAIAIGNEGKGLSDGLAAICGDFVKIPMERGSESLNAAVAASIFMWEMYETKRVSSR